MMHNTMPILPFSLSLSLSLSQIMSNISSDDFGILACKTEIPMMIAFVSNAFDIVFHTPKFDWEWQPNMLFSKQ